MSTVQKKAENGTRKTTGVRKTAPTPVPIKKKNFVQRMIDKTRKVIIKVKTTRGGRIAVRVTEIATGGLALYKAYDMGRKSVKPTTVVITEGVQEQPEPEPEPKEETATEEPNEEETTEV